MKNARTETPRRTVLLLGAALAGWCAGCSVLPAEETASSDGFSTAKAEPVEKTADTGFHLRDNDALYTVYDDSGVVTMYLTWEQINSYSAYDYEAMQVPAIRWRGLLQVGDESGPAASEVGGTAKRSPTPRCRSGARLPAGMPRKTTRSS